MNRKIAGEIINIDKNRRSSKRLKAFGLFCIVGFIAAIIFTTLTFNTSSTAEAALKTGVSTTLQAGIEDIGDGSGPVKKSNEFDSYGPIFI